MIYSMPRHMKFHLVKGLENQSLNFYISKYKFQLVFTWTQKNPMNLNNNIFNFKTLFNQYKI